MRGLHPHPHFLGRIALDHSRAAERRTWQGRVPRFNHIHFSAQEVRSLEEPNGIDRQRCSFRPLREVGTRLGGDRITEQREIVLGEFRHKHPRESTVLKKVEPATDVIGHIETCSHLGTYSVRHGCLKHGCNRSAVTRQKVSERFKVKLGIDFQVKRLPFLDGFGTIGTEQGPGLKWGHVHVSFDCDKSKVTRFEDTFARSQCFGQWWCERRSFYRPGVVGWEIDPREIKRDKRNKEG